MIQIRALHLFNFENAVRTVRFRLGRVNVITGASQRGKSAILDIIDFCTGSRSYNVAEGRIRDTVAVYALELQTPEGIVIAARPAPDEGRSSNTVMYLGFSDGINPPSPQLLRPNYELAGAREFLSRLAGIRDNETDPAGGARESFTANIRHAMFYTMQSQSEVANRDILFHSQGEERIPQAIRDTMPYFLGATDPDYVRKRNALRDAQRELRGLDRQRNESASIGASPRAASLLAEAARSGLIPSRQLEDERGTLEILADAARADVGDVDDAVGDGLSEAISGLRDEREALRQEAASLRSQNENLRQLLAAHGSFGTEAAEQGARLESLGLLRLERETPVAEITSCPVCASTLDEAIDGIGDLQDSLRSIQRDIQQVGQSVPRIQQLISANESELSDLNGQLRANTLALEQQTAAQADIEELSSRALQRAAVRGRINLYLESVSRDLEDVAIAARIRELQESIDLLEEALRSDETEVRLESALNRVSRTLSSVAQELNLEHSEFPARLDRRRLTVVVDMRQGPRTLAQIGSAANWLGYHIAVLISLHDFFLTENRPVPRFLVMDQPSQVYFPQGAQTNEVSLADEDSAALARFFRRIFDFVESASEGFQVILLEHADLADDWYQDAIVERWRGPGNALIPQDW
ncbi:DUF3732 domain-containing protein [Actinomycetospora corticicola]|uniref:Molecular chaperone GrpE (Heat shock protein) n=1 Tax=Actinomycetospora corticicola TaxID=663602 RepID=A0A7Y9DZ26_9PSEU|nr:DUF3732 domain-containing protein [Actinomycetospora corticicola]NYD38040.1 molecular chaperone GrpE (heat shock protein) [Actinomycetospora corticicola]